jgi:hypothetical protein
MRVRQPPQFCEHLRAKVRNSAVRKPIGGLRGVGTLGVFAAKVLFSFTRCPWPEVELLIREQVIARS